MSQLNGCAYCVRVHGERAAKAGITVDVIAQLPVWRESGVFSDRERAGLELAEAFTFIHEEGVPDDVYNRVGGVLSETGVRRRSAGSSSRSTRSTASRSPGRYQRPAA